MRGEECIFSHDVPRAKRGSSETANLEKDPLRSVAPLRQSLQLPNNIMDWFEDHSDRLFFLGDGDFDFTRCLTTLGLGPPFASDKQAEVQKIGVTTVLRLDATRMHLEDIVGREISNGKIDTFFWNFAYTEENEGANEELLLGTFHSLLEAFRMAARQRCNALELTFALTLQGDQFSRWNVLRSAMRTGWRLSKWGVFNPDDFPGYKPRRDNGDIFPVDSPRLYEFKIHSNHLNPF